MIPLGDVEEWVTEDGYHVTWVASGLVRIDYDPSNPVDAEHPLNP